ncbi:metal ABC transporter ATP-binding protein [Streptococcus hongkongensis]|nr:manganese ABC transporter ATP-binding protein [Streptococcus uberis]
MISIKNLNVIYSGNIEALTDITIDINEGGIIGILGPNGAGKSTFMKAILGLIPYSGQITLTPMCSNLGKTAISYVEQRSHIDVNFPMTVSECVLLGTYGRLGVFKKVGQTEKRKVNHYLEKVGLLDFVNRPIKSLSGGQFQRMLLARCLIQEKQFLFLDEPFVGIDSLSESIILGLLRELANEGKTILIVHHDLSKVEEYFDRILLLNKQLLAYGSIEEAFTIPALEKAYGDHLIRR